MVMYNTREENQDYDFWLNWIPTYRCNLNCAYCFENPIKKSAKISKIDISALTRTLNETNRVFKISFVGGGEPFLIPNIVEACVEITRNHFIGFNTNLTTGKIIEFSEKMDPERVLYIISALHIKELERLNLLEKYIHNFRLCKEKGFNITANVVAYPPLLDEVEKYKEFFQEKGIRLKIGPFIGEYNGKIYPDSYTEKEIRILGLDDKDPKKYKQKGKLCNAGYNVGVVNPNGYISPCLKISKSIGNIYDKIKFSKKLIRCPFESCKCPLNIFDSYLFEKAKKETNSDIVAPIFLIKYLLREYLKEAIMKHLPNYMRKEIFNFAIRHGL